MALRQYWDLLYRYLKPQGRSALLLGLLLLADIGLKLASPQVVARFIDSASAGAPAQTLTLLALLFLFLAILDEAVIVTSSYVGEKVGWTATNALRADLALHCLRLDLSFHKAHTPGELIERIDGDVTALFNFFARSVALILGTALFMVVVLALLFRLDWRIGLALTFFVAIALVWLNQTRGFAVPRWAAARQANAELFGFLEERLAGTEDIRSSGATAYVMRRLYELMRVRLRTARTGRLMDSGLWASTTLLFAIGTVAALGVAAGLYQAGAITLGSVYLIFQYTEMLRRPAELINQELQALQKAGASISRIRELYHLQSVIQDGPGIGFPSGPLSVEFHNLSFEFEDGDSVLHHLSFRLQPGRVLGVLGRTGSGKTTLTRLLFRLYDPTTGSIRLGGVDLRLAHTTDLRAHVGMVTQEVQLFRASVRDNLTFFDRSIPDERIQEVLRELGLWNWYRSLPDGLDSMLESGGSGLSAGEGQLLAFARVFLKDPGLVILDEASSRLDPATERLLERAIDRLLQGRTGIIIAHRLGTVQRADDILILEEGRIQEHDERDRLASDPHSRFASLLRTGLEEALA